MRVLADLFMGLLLALVLLAGLGALGMGFSEPEKRGSLAVAGAVLIGSTMITLAIMNQSGDRDR
jgi:hypothetical protein